MDVITVPVEIDIDKIDGRFRLVNIVAQRAKELALRNNPKMHSHYAKVTTVALEEAVNYKLDYITGEEAKIAKEEAKKMDYKRFLEEKRRETEPEDLSELEKDLKFYLNEKEEIEKRSIDELFSSIESSTVDEDEDEE